MIVSGAVGKGPFWGAHSETWAGRKEGRGLDGKSSARRIKFFAVVNARETPLRTVKGFHLQARVTSSSQGYGHNCTVVYR